VDEVVEDTPYTPSIGLLDELNVDYCAHGDDMPINEHGIGCYDEIKRAGRLRVFKRTEGISTTEIIGRLLTCTKEKKSIEFGKHMTSSEIVNQLNASADFEKGPVMSNFLTTSWRIAEFSNNKTPKDGDRIVYIDGSFDILHIGHIEALRKAKELGDFLFVGVHSDATVNEHRGKNYPILNLQERVFNLLALRYVDDVVIGAPWTLTEDLIKSLKITVVVQGTAFKYDEDFLGVTTEKEDPYYIPKKMGIYQQIASEYDLTNEILITRLLNKRGAYIKKYQTKNSKEIEYYSQQKEYIQEI